MRPLYGCTTTHSRGHCWALNSSAPLGSVVFCVFEFAMHVSSWMYGSPGDAADVVPLEEKLGLYMAL